ncbi:hypothetical protein H1R20_g2347, partial [Candolleomyces eurysporus]
MKVFVNICYDKGVPPPPEGSEDAIQKAMKGESTSPLEGEDEEEEWYVPVVVSEPRLDKDKAGKQSLVVDCVYNSEVRSRTLRDPDFKIFLVELGLQRIEGQTGLTLSRNIGTPNIAAKGKLQPRTVRIPTALLNPPPSSKASSEDVPSALLVEKKTGRKSKGKEKEILDKGKAMDNVNSESKEGGGAQASKRPLIEEIGPGESADAEKPKGILKQPSSASPSTPTAAATKEQEQKSDFMIPIDVSWSWEKLDSGKLQVTIYIPDLTASSITSGQTYLDIEPRRIIVTLTNNESIDIDRSLPDAQLTAKIRDRAKEKADVLARHNKGTTKLTKELEELVIAESDKEVTSMLLLKRERAFDVDAAKAQWFVKDKKLVITL